VNLEFSPQILEENSNTEFRHDPSGGSRVVACGQTDGHDEADSRFSRLCERA
jgi:hypothetical protein